MSAGISENHCQLDSGIILHSVMMVPQGTLKGIKSLAAQIQRHNAKRPSRGSRPTDDLLYHEEMLSQYG